MYMKILLVAFAILVVVPIPGRAAEFEVFKVCDDPRAFRTADGADAGHAEYVVLEASGQGVVAAILTGGVLGTRLVSVPATAMSHGRENEVTLRDIRRERLINAPVIERASLLRSTRMRSEIIESSYTHFGALFHAALPIPKRGSGR